MSAERAPIKVLLRDEQSGGAVSVIESGSLPDFGIVRRRGDKKTMRMRELIVFADVTLDGFIAESMP